ncbi:transcriptional regulator [Streptomyces sp. Act143]|uniref:WhiB family transcriptional regulator n=1 Tax=Streptomyces sp. Act143 TaxID=2200760 RepID=UPI000D6772DA|nr:WhiB family transcriptional regulator [Streptomyces sp. Act143]PWI16060.1 transcriptional regulator [Streptomyces sp. Act143]
MLLPRASHGAPHDTLPRPDHWSDAGVCKTSLTPDIWFAEEQDPEAVADRQEAKRACGRCPVRTPCLHDALARGEKTGIWGGLDTAERSELLLLPTAREPVPTEEASSGPRHEAAKSA